jgi:hypothetical protein
MMKALLMSSLILISAAAVDVEKEEHLRLHQQHPANHRNTQTTDSSNNSSCIEVSIFLDEYPADTRWDIFDDPPPVNTTTAEPLATSPTYNESMALTQQTTQICTLDTPGNYSFIMYDDFFDGICCEWGNGSYAVILVNTGEVLASGGQWSGPSESTRFVLDGPPTTSTAVPTSAPTSALTSKMSNNRVEGDEASTTTQTETLQKTCEIYVSIFAALFVIFLLVRPKYPRFYNIKKSYANLSTPIAQESYGHVTWIWKVFTQFSYEMIADQCGMDAVTTIRLLEFGVKLSAVGIFNSIYLMPIYSSMGNMTAATSMTSDYQNIKQANDPVVAVSLSNLPQGSNAAYATTFSAYIFFGFAMYFIATDFQWFTSLRHDFLSKERVQNYTVYLSGLPKELQSNAAIRDYFSHCFSHNENIVADVALALKIPNLEKKSQKRDKILPKLEHAINVKEVKGETPFHKTKLCGEQKESIPTWTKELQDLNLEISEEIARIELLQATRVAGSNEIMKEESNEAKADDVEVGISVAETTMPLQSTKSSVVSSVSGTMKSATGAVAGGVKSSVSMAKSLLAKNEDGMTRSAAFISFTEILYANLARQALHSKSAWKIVPSEPPLPELVNWKNVGQPASSRQIGELLSLLLTGVLCIFWTIPVSFFASLGNVSKLTEVMPFLAEPVKTYPWFSALLSQLAPLILVVFIALLPHILLVFCKLELLIEIESMQHPSLFNKLASFTILQTFFISTIASTLFTSLEAISKDPSMVSDFCSFGMRLTEKHFISHRTNLFISRQLPL